LKIAYFGLPLGALLLSADGHELALTVLSPIDAPGRRRLLQLGVDPIDALESEAPVEPEVEERLGPAQPDLLVSWFWTRRLPERWLKVPRLGAVGAHPSLLPRHRGPNPYFWSIDSGDAVAGVTIHRLTAEYDTGVMLASRAIPVAGRDSWQLARALDRPALAELRAVVARLARGDALAEAEQDEALATWAPEPTGELLHVDFGWTTERVLRRIRALSPTPGLALEVLGVPLFVTRAEPAPDFVQALLPGEADLRGALVLRTGDGAVRVSGAHFPDSDVSETSSDAVLARLRSVSAWNRGIE
jgi:methionyl-tRNA formyltransferase